MKIKLKETSKKAIKTLDKSLIVGNKFKNNLVTSKERIDNIGKEDEESTFNQLNDSFSIKGTNSLIDTFNKNGRDAVLRTKKKINTVKSKINNQKGKGIKQNKVKIKVINNTEDNSTKNLNNNLGKIKKIKRDIISVSKKTFNSSKKIIKGLIEAFKTLIDLLFASSWIIMIVIVIICIIGLICTSTFGIFFANETNNRSMSSVISEINNDINTKIELIKNATIYDDISIDTTYSNFKDVIAIYSVKFSDDKSSNNIILELDEDNVSKLKQVFWKMNNISYKVISEKYFNEEGKEIEENILHINFDIKSREEIMQEYDFTEEQQHQVEDLLSSQYDVLWYNLLYGSMEGNSAIVTVALNELNNTGGEKYWRWYGLETRTEWCAIFVSWAANEIGLLNTTIPKFASVRVGINWFKQNGLWQEKSYVPRTGDIIFFDWENDGKANHTGIVEKVEDNVIYTVEGNSDDAVKERKYDISSNVIFGYGVPNYNS